MSLIIVRFGEWKSSLWPLLIAHARGRVYDRCMVRKCATLAFGLALILALGFAMAHAHPLKVPGASTGLSMPCEPASPMFKAASESKAVSTIDSTFAAESIEVPVGVVQRCRIEMGSRGSPPPAPRVFPPLLHRPPPENS